MLGVIQAGKRSIELIKDIVNWISKRWELTYKLKKVKFKAPLQRANVLRDFLAFRGHVEATYRRRGQSIPEEWLKIPVYYKGIQLYFMVI